MATLAKRRLDRAQLYLDLAHQHSADRAVFTAHLETFVAYSRSVLHVLKDEVDAAGVFKCFETEWDALRREPLPEFFRNMRDTVLHNGVEGARARGEFVEVLAPARFTIEGYPASLEVRRADGTIEKDTTQEPPPAQVAESKPVDTGEASARYFFVEGDFKDQEVFSVCQQYLTRLAQAIQVAEKCGA